MHKLSWQALEVENSAPNHPGKLLRPHPTGNAHMETTHFKKGLPLLTPQKSNDSDNYILEFWLKNLSACDNVTLSCFLDCFFSSGIYSDWTRWSKCSLPCVDSTATPGVKNRTKTCLEDCEEADQVLVEEQPCWGEPDPTFCTTGPSLWVLNHLTQTSICPVILLIFFLYS